MAILSTGNTFVTDTQVTAAALNSAVNSAAFDTPADDVTLEVSSNVLQLKDGGTLPAKLSTGAPEWDASGNTTITGQVIISGASAGQIAFPATQNASANANTLDDYEEGTFTPSLGGTATYTSRTGTYTKIGNVVHFSVDMTVNTIGTGDTNVISGLPFTASGRHAAVVGDWSSAAGSFVFMAGRVSSTSITITALSSAATSVSTSSVVFGNGTAIVVSGTYLV